MKHKRLLAAAIALTTASVLMLLGHLRLTAQGRTVAIAGNHPNIALTGWKPAAGELEMHMTAVLALRKQRELAELTTQLRQPDSPNYHKWLSSAEFARRFGPTRPQMDDVTGWLGANHFTIDQADLATRAVRFSGTVTQVERAFSTEIVSSAGRYANATDPRIPARLAGTIAAIFGLSGQAAANQSAWLPDLKSADVPAVTIADHFTPQDFWHYYDESPPVAAGNNGGTGAGDCIGLMESVGIRPVEIDAFDKQFGLPPAVVTTVPTDPSSPVTYTDQSHETELDAEWTHAVAPNTPIVLYVITGPSQTAFDALNLAVTQNACGTISSSIHTCANDAEIKAYFAIEREAVIQGQTLFHASGDFGSFFACGQPAAKERMTGVQPSIDETASSPDVTVVGGTQFSPVWKDGVDTSVLAPGFEHVWNTFVTVTATPGPTATPTPDCKRDTYGCKGGSGGGLSVVPENPKPLWQDGVVPYGLAPSGFTQRGVPDVASVSNPDEPGLWVSGCFPDTKPCIFTPFTIKESGSCPAGEHLCFFGSGGTSAGSPVWAGISRLLAQNICATRLGNINPQLYALASTGSDALVDVSQRGQNCPQAGLNCTVLPGYQVGPGYDLGTGLGSADIDKLVAAFSPPTPSANVTSSNTTSSGSAGQTVDGGSITLTNTGALPETVSTVRLDVSAPTLFSSLSISASVDGGAELLAVSGPLGSTVTFVFPGPGLTVPPGGAAVLTLSAGIAAGSQAASGAVPPGSMMAGGGRGAGKLAAVLSLIGLGLVLVPGEIRRRLRLFSMIFLLIAATQAGCGSDNGNRNAVTSGTGSGATVVGTSVQSVPDCGAAVNDPNGAVSVTGLPATFGQIRSLE